MFDINVAHVDIGDIDPKTRLDVNLYQNSLSDNVHYQVVHNKESDSVTESARIAGVTEEHAQGTLDSFISGSERALKNKKTPTLRIKFHIIPSGLFSMEKDSEEYRAVRTYLKATNVVGISSSWGYQSYHKHKYDKNALKRYPKTPLWEMAKELGVVFLQSSGNQQTQIESRQRAQNVFYVGSKRPYDTVVFPHIEDKLFSPFTYFPVGPEKIKRKGQTNVGTSFSAPNFLGSLVGVTARALANKAPTSANAFLKATMLSATKLYRDKHNIDTYWESKESPSTAEAINTLDKIVGKIVNSNNSKPRVAGLETRLNMGLDQ